MNMNKILCYTALFLAFAAHQAQAASIQCTSAQVLDETSEDCSHNPRYTRAGKECLGKLEKLVSQATDIPTGKLKDQWPSSRKIGQDKAEQLLLAAKAAKEYISSYRDNIFYPEDWDAPEELIGDPMDFFDSQKCYSKARDSLAKFEETVDHYIKELERAR